MKGAKDVSVDSVQNGAIREFREATDAFRRRWLMVVRHEQTEVAKLHAFEIVAATISLADVRTRLWAAARKGALSRPKRSRRSTP
jgi:hypothetical protein